MTIVAAHARRTTFLRTVLLADAASGIPLGVLLALASDPIARWLQLPAPLLFDAGLFLIPFGAGIAWLASRSVPPPAGVWAVIGVNALWAAGSFAMLAAGAIAPTALGYGLFVLQAAGAALLGALELTGLRKAAAPA